MGHLDAHDYTCRKKLIIKTKKNFKKLIIFIIYLNNLLCDKYLEQIYSYCDLRYKYLEQIKDMKI